MKDYLSNNTKYPVNLPLGWHISSEQNSDDLFVKLYSNVYWLALSRFSATEILLSRISCFREAGKHLMIRGCGSGLYASIKACLPYSINFGSEAVLLFEGNHFSKRSLKELIRRGKKKGTVFEAGYSEMNIRNLENLKAGSAHAGKPQLNFLFFTDYEPGMKLYFYQNNSNEIMAALLLSENSGLKIQAELLLRKKNAPIGAMEYLIYFAFNSLKDSRFKYFSLGEVPFVINNTERSLKTITLRLAGKFFSFAYNFEGLYNFKNKFNPVWNDLAICSSKKIRLFDFFMVAYRSNFLSLAAYKLKYIAKDIFIRP